MRTDHTSSVEEADNDPAAEAPAREADCEGLQVAKQSLASWEIGIGPVRDGVDLELTLELLAKVLCIVLNDVVIPLNVKSAAVAAP